MDVNPVVIDHPNKISYNPVRIPFELNNQSNVIKVSIVVNA